MLRLFLTSKFIGKKYLMVRIAGAIISLLIVFNLKSVIKTAMRYSFIFLLQLSHLESSALHLISCLFSCSLVVIWHFINDNFLLKLPLLLLSLFNTLQVVQFIFIAVLSFFPALQLIEMKLIGKFIVVADQSTPVRSCSGLLRIKSTSWLILIHWHSGKGVIVLSYILSWPVHLNLGRSITSSEFMIIYRLTWSLDFLFQLVDHII